MFSVTFIDTFRTKMVLIATIKNRNILSFVRLGNNWKIIKLDTSRKENATLNVV